MSLIARSAPLRMARSVQISPLRQQARSVHFDNVVDHTLPTSVKNKYWLAVKLVSYASLGFGLPFGAAVWHVQKSAGGA